MRTEFIAKFHALLLLGGAIPFLAGQAPTQVPPHTQGGRGGGRAYRIYDTQTLARGRAIFVTQCGFCHGSNAKGGESGPDLLRAVPVLDDEDGNLIGPIVLGGREDRGMPKFSFTKEQISDIAAFLHEGIRAAAQRSTYKLLDIVTGDPKKGEAYFNGAGRCATCHSITGDLQGIGSKYDPAALQGRFLMPRSSNEESQDKQDKQVPITVNVKLRAGETVTGELLHIDDFTVSLRDSAGDYRAFDRDGDTPGVVLKDPLQPHLDMLPKYTDTDIHNLTAYLVGLK